MDASIGLRKSTASGGLEDGSQRMWLFHTVTLLTEPAGLEVQRRGRPVQPPFAAACPDRTRG
jgi:hypothetical protein